MPQQQQQYAQIITPGGQIQTVQIASLAQMGTTLLSPGQQSQSTGTTSSSTANSSSTSGSVTITTAGDGGLHINTVDNTVSNAGTNQTTTSTQQSQQQLQSVPQQITISGNKLI